MFFGGINTSSLWPFCKRSPCSRLPGAVAVHGPQAAPTVPGTWHLAYLGLARRRGLTARPAASQQQTGFAPLLP